MKTIIFVIFVLSLTMAPARANTFTCSKVLPRKLHLVKPAPCSDSTYWDYSLDPVRKTDPAKFNRIVTEKVIKTSNMGGSVFTFPSGKTKKVYRASYVSKAKACLTKLVKSYNLKTIINYYSGGINTTKALDSDEKELFLSLGGLAYTRFMGLDYKLKHKTLKQINAKILQVIKLIEASPGNVLIHCFGGVHRTGIVYGVMQKCLNKLPLETIIKEYKCHASWENEKKTGGFNKDNIKVIKEFPCKLLD